MGAGALYLPDYRGSDQGRAYLLPVPYVVYRGSWFKSDRDGTRALLAHTERITLDISVGASAPAHTRDNAARSGMPNLPGTFEVGPNLNLVLAQTPAWQLDLRLPLRAAMTLERSPQFIGNTFSPNLNLDFKYVGGGWNVGLLTGPLFADKKNHGFFYDVTPSQATPWRASYQSSGGYSGWRVLASTSRRWGPAWLGAFIRYDHLGGAAFETSPLVRRTSALTAGIAMTWVFASSSEQVASLD
jgi:outer membrane protein